MANIYDNHAATFSKVSAYVILKDGERVATVAIKHGAVLFAFVHWIGVEMAKGRAAGGGYDKATAAVETAVQNAKPQMDAAAQDPTIATDTNARALDAFRFAILTGRDDAHWYQRLEEAGFKVLQAV